MADLATPAVNINAKPRVLVTRRLPGAVEAQLTERFDATLNTADTPLSPAEIRQALATHDAVLPTGADRLGAEALDVRKAQTRILSNYGVGTGHICAASARKLGLTVTNTPDVVSECTADLAMTLLLMLARRAGEGERALRRDQGAKAVFPHLSGTKVSGKTLGLVGFGGVGREMARRAHHGFGMQVLVYDTRPIPGDTLAALGARQVDTLDRLLPLCDFVSLHCSEDPGNRHLINGRRLDRMKEDALLISTVRGDVIDEQALTQALMFETIGGAALDIFADAPPLSPLLMECDNLVVLPHLGAATREARTAMGLRVLDNLGDFFEGREPRDRVV